MNVSLKIKIFDAKGTHLVAIAKTTATVGSAPHCDVVLNHPSVQPEHIRAWCEGGRIWVQDLSSSTGSAINGIHLPALKPMLVRELDVLKLGQCPATLSLEPNLVRAPVVNPKVDLDEFTATDIKGIVPNDPDVEKMGRELAELKLQLQMARLDKGAGEDLRKETDVLRAEVNKLSMEKKKLKDSFNQVDVDKKNYRKQLENELAELKLKSLRELKEQREEDQRKLAEWKRAAVKHLGADVHVLNAQKVKAWITRPLSKDMMLEWEADLNEIFRKQLLGEQEPQMALPPEAPLKADTQVSRIRPQTQTGIKKVGKNPPGPRHRDKDSLWSKIAVFGFAFALILGAVWFVKFKPRGIEGSRATASQIPVSAPPMQPEQLAPPPAARRPPPQAPVAAKKAVSPPQDKSFKKTYTDNVLFTVNYVDAELNMDFRALWIKNLNKVGRGEWKLTARALGSIATNELVLIQDLGRIRNSIGPAQESDRVGQMRQRESQFIKELQKQLGKKATVEKFMKLKRSFYTRNQVYLSRENR